MELGLIPSQYIHTAEELRQQAEDTMPLVGNSTVIGSSGLGAALHRDQLEIKRQNERWGSQNHDPATWATILAEECGEVARAALAAKYGKANLTQMIEEAVQVAAVAIQIAMRVQQPSRE